MSFLSNKLHSICYVILDYNINYQLNIKNKKYLCNVYLQFIMNLLKIKYNYHLNNKLLKLLLEFKYCK